MIQCTNPSKGQFTRYDFVACDELTIGLRHKDHLHAHDIFTYDMPKSCATPLPGLGIATNNMADVRQVSAAVIVAIICK